MKKIYFYCFALFGLLMACGAMAQTKAVQTPSVMPGVRNNPLTSMPTVNGLNVEAPFRCSVKEFGDIEVMTTISLRPKDFKLTQADKLDRIPRFEVNGFSFDSMPVDEALQLLVDEADISVYTEDGVYPELNASDLYGELEPVLDELTAAGDIYYRYDAARKRLHLSRRAKFDLQLPPNRAVMFAMLDALRGAGIPNASPNWKKYTISMDLTRAEEQTVNSLVDYILKDSKLLLADTQVYLLNPRGADAHWQNVVNLFGPGRIYTADKGLLGRLITMGHKNKTEDLLAALQPNFSASLLSEGIAIVPHGWKMRFDVGRCAKTAADVNSLSVLLNTNIRSPEQVETVVSLDTLSGEVTSFDVTTSIDNELAIIGIPASVLGDGYQGEVLVTLKLRFIRLVP